ncbi:MAG TPA: AAA family ATPase [Chthoniobacterales bacterium]|nr:AAA family ATPase [Chthoniobacterales bacterium]
MAARRPTIYLIAGCNGAGKTTFALEYLAQEANCRRFLNADEIARGLSPLDPTIAAMKAGRLLLAEIRSAIARKQTFGLETTLSGRTHIALLQRACERGYDIELHYLWLASPAEALERVRQRVRKGGHNVPAADVRRRYHRGLKNLLSDYLPMATRWIVWDAGRLPPRMLANSSTHSSDQVKLVLRS